MNFIFGLFWIFCVLFFLAGLIYFVAHSSEETGLDEIGSVAAFFIFLAALSGIVVLLIYSRKKMYTSTIIDEKGIRYLNKFNDKIVKEFPWSSFSQKEDFVYVLESLQYDINSSTPTKSLFDQFYWPVLVNEKVEIHTDAFLGKHFFSMFYANRLELIRTFLLGVRHYKPGITIDPSIFANHYINPETYVIDYRKRRRIGIIGSLICVFVLAILYYWIVY
ncbi:hypothetical protein [Flavobacterium sp. JAS]|uniref:hypothetical protein n=1 Tax=Flavobacterium sp. JAS TaxID=2897329 RepID=UPI001E33E1C9|nr:hypothetical protein [Flavobacterium sp. JAS]MCD0469674.1 hypothetical protein [Flavobacterium sp. JAS]